MTLNRNKQGNKIMGYALCYELLGTEHIYPTRFEAESRAKRDSKWICDTSVRGPKDDIVKFKDGERVIENAPSSLAFAL